MSYDKYESPLSQRYASKEMQYIFSPDKKFKTWRKLWIALAEVEKELELPDENGNPRITQEMIDELKANAEDIDYEMARRKRLLFVTMLWLTFIHMEQSVLRLQASSTLALQAATLVITLMSLL